MVLGNLLITDITYVDLLFVIVLGWILVVLWQRPIDNFTYITLGLNKDSTYHTFVIALIATAIFLAFVFSFDSILGNIVENSTGTGGYNPPAPPVNPPNPPAANGPTATTTDLTINDFGDIVVETNPTCRSCIRIF